MTQWEDITDVERAEVYKAGVLAAELRRTDDGVLFTYSPDYDGPPVASTLPVSIRSVLRPGGALPAYFTGLLPEGRRLGALRRAVKTSVDDELSLLLAVGADTIGDVAIVPAGERPVAGVSRVVLDGSAPLDFGRLITELDADPDRTALPGVQDKVSAAMISLPAERAGQAHILKLDPPEYRHLVENEDVFLRAAVLGGLSAAQASVLRDVTGRPGLLVRRFDRVPHAEGTVRALAVEDGCQALGRYPGDKYTVGYAATFRALSAICDARLLAVRTLLAQLAFSIVTANGDAHAKNFSVLQQSDGEWVVSPAYDVPSSHPYGDHTLAMSVNSRRSDVGAGDLLALGRDLGLPEAAVRRVLRSTTEGVARWIDLCEALPYDAGTRAKLVRVVRQRQRRLTP